MPPRRANAPTGRFEFRFATTLFDIESEPPDGLNGHAGHSLLAWLRGRLEPAGFRTEEPWAETWGWCMGVFDPGGRRYRVGAVAFVYARRPVPPGTDLEWLVQVWRSRTLVEWIRREPRARPEDPLPRFLVEVFLGPGFREREFLERDGEVLHSDETRGSPGPNHGGA